MAEWRSIEAEEGVVHLMPVDDLIAHEASDDCACGPGSECVTEEGERDNWLMTHRSLDGREVGQ